MLFAVKVHKSGLNIEKSTKIKTSNRKYGVLMKNKGNKFTKLTKIFSSPSK